MSGTDKNLAIIMVCVILLSVFPVAGYLAILVLLSRLIRQNSLGKLFNVVRKDYGLVFLLVSFALSAVFTKQHFASLAGVTVFGLQVLLFAVIRSHVSDRDSNFNIVRYLLITSIFVSVIGIFQYYFGSYMHPEWVDRSLYNNISNRAFSTLYNPNVLGSYFILIISIALAGFKSSDGRYSLILNTLVLITGGVCMVLTFSRGAWMGLAVSILVILVFGRRKRLILTILAVSLLTALIALPEFKTIMSRINLDFISNDSSNTYRWYLWKFAVKTFTEHPLVGSGIGSFGFYIPSHFKAPGYLVSHAHNIYLQLLAETGILGFTAFISFVLTSMYVSFKLFRSSPCDQTRSLALGVMASSAGLLAHGSVDATLYLPQLSVFVWISIAVIRNLGEMEFAYRPILSRLAVTIKPVLTRIFLNVK